MFLAVETLPTRSTHFHTSMPSFAPVTALMRGLEVLRVVNSQGEVTIAELQRRTNLHRPTVVRMLETLEEAGYVTRRNGSARYMPTGRVLQLSRGYLAHERVQQIAEPVLAQVREHLGWPSAIAIPDGTSMMIAYSSRTFDGLQLNGRLGTRAPMLGSALGRAYIAHCPKPTQERSLALLQATSSDPFDRRWVADSEALKKALETIRANGFAMSDEAYTRSLYNDAAAGFAVPVICNGQAIAAINIVFFTAALSMSDALATLLPELRHAAQQIGAMLATETGDGAVLPADPA